MVVGTEDGDGHRGWWWAQRMVVGTEDGDGQRGWGWAQRMVRLSPSNGQQVKSVANELYSQPTGSMNAEPQGRRTDLRKMESVGDMCQVGQLRRCGRTQLIGLDSLGDTQSVQLAGKCAEPTKLHG